MKIQSRSVLAPWLLAQTIDGTDNYNPFVIGGALVVLGIGVTIIALARAGRRRELEERLVVRSEAVALAEPRRPDQLQVKPLAPIFIDLSDGSPDFHDAPEPSAAAGTGRKSPMAAFEPEGKAPPTFIDLPAPGAELDPVVDLSDDSIDLTRAQERQGTARPGDPWSGGSQSHRP
ncbi:MAG: hypothetical protein OEX97_07870 [Acidimicrobiia bacterium]|nr:hypothetical protein [Acidimicrobiia bacterium]